MLLVVDAAVVLRTGRVRGRRRAGAGRVLAARLVQLLLVLQEGCRGRQLLDLLLSLRLGGSGGRRGRLVAVPFQ